MVYHSYSRKPAKKSPAKRWLLLIIPVLVIAGLVYWLLAGGHKAEAPQASEQSSSTSSSTPEQPAYTAIDLQPTVAAWVAKQSADYSIEVYDAQADKIIAQNNPGKVLFAASLYKIYVAYLMLKDFQTGAQNPNELLSGSNTKKVCVDRMIRESYSPCGEAAMADMGQSVLNQRVIDELDATGTFFTGIRTSAADSIKVLEAIDTKKDLTDENMAFLRDAMLTQDAKFKRGLQAGAPGAKWETKVGWNEDQNYHDIGIMTMPDGRVFYVAILGQGSGSPTPLADFSKSIYAALK